MATAITEKELLGLEIRYWQAMKDGDVDAMMRLTDLPCIVAGAQGVGSMDRPEFEAMNENSSYKLERFEFKEGAKMRSLGEDVAVLAYEVHVELTVDGRPVELDAAETSTWIRRNGHWACALHSESIEGDPFGRDRNSERGPTVVAYE
jgi:hypothetical protein